MSKENDLPDTPSRTIPIRQHRTLFLSDLHLGSIGARADLVLRFLQQNRAKTYILAGDIVDIALPFSLARKAACRAVIDHLRQRQAEGARLVCLVGNHDPHPLEPSHRLHLPVDTVDDFVHVGADGRRYLVVHGHLQDRAIFRSHLVTRLGAFLENMARLACGVVSSRSKRYALSRGGLVDKMISAVNSVLSFGRGHERRLVELARQRGCNGVICGHYHRADMHLRHGLIYANCGDWVTSITCLTEDFNGQLRLVDGRAALAFAPGLLPETQVIHA